MPGNRKTGVTGEDNLDENLLLLVVAPWLVDSNTRCKSLKLGEHCSHSVEVGHFVTEMAVTVTYSG